MKNFLKNFIPGFTTLLFLAVTTLGVFIGGMWAIAGIGGAIILFAAVWAADKRVPVPAPDLAVMAVITLVVMALSNFHSSQPSVSWSEWERLGTIFLPLLVFSSPAVQARADCRRLFAILPIAAAASALLLGMELDSGGVLLQVVKGQPAALTGYNRGLSYLVILAFPIVAGLILDVRCQTSGVEKRNSILGIRHPTSGIYGLIALFILALLIAASLTESRASKLALIVALAVMACAHFWPVLTRRFLTALPVLCIGWPFAAQKFFLAHYEVLKHFPDSWRARIEIWDYLSYRIMEHPILGWGLGTSRSLDSQNPHGAQYLFVASTASHPHNVVTQLWVELGLPGVVLGLAFALLTLRKASRLDPELTPFALGAWAAALCLSLVAYNFWTDSLFAAFALTGFAFTLLERRVRTAG